MTTGLNADRQRADAAGPAGTTLQLGSTLLGLATTALLIFLLYGGRELLIPMVLAVLLAFVLAPVVHGLQRLYLGGAVAVVVAVLLAFLILFGIGLAVSRQASELAPHLPEYRIAVTAQLDRLHLSRVVDSVMSLASGVDARAPAVPGGEPVAAAQAAPQPLPAATPIAVLFGIAQPLLAPLATVGIVIVFVIFILLYREDLRDRFIRLAGIDDLYRTITVMNDAALRLSRYFLVQVGINSAYGAFIAAGLWWLGLPNPLLWGILAALMRFVPFVGTLIALVPPFLLALAVHVDWSLALWVLPLFLVSEVFMGQVVEPLVYGHSTGLSPPALIFATAFWAFIWGPIGLLVATPLTVCLVVLGRHVKHLQFLDVLLGDRPPLRPEQVFYQQALQGDASGLFRQVNAQLGKEATLTAWGDDVVLKGLCLAQADWTREMLQPEQADAIRRQVAALLARLTTSVKLAGPPPADPAWRDEGAVLCIAGQGPFDHLAAETAALVLRGYGFGAQAAANTALGASELDLLPVARTRLCLLSVLAEGSSVTSVQILLRRLNRVLPQAHIAVAMWHASMASPSLAALREGGDCEAIVGSVGEVLALCQSTSALPAPHGGGAVIPAGIGYDGDPNPGPGATRTMLRDR